MITINNLHEVEKIFRNMLAKQSGLQLNRVLNGLSIRGQDLTKYLNSTTISSIDTNDSLMLFELYQGYDDDIDMTEEDDSITRFTRLRLKVILYGYSSANLARIVSSRLRTQKCIYDLHSQGVYLNKINKCESINEIYNETTYFRTDFEIECSCVMSISQIDNFTTYASFNDFEIIDSEYVSSSVLIDVNNFILTDINDYVLTDYIEY